MNELQRLRAEVTRLRDALDTIESAPEDPAKVQEIARAALIGPTWVMPEDTLDPLAFDYWESAP